MIKLRSIPLLLIAALPLLMGCNESANTTPQAQESAIEADATPVLSDSASTAIPMDVYKSPTCGCCGEWVEHAEQRGFALTTHHPADLNQLKADRGIAAQYQSCHTAVSAEGFVFEGHIPARYIRDFLAQPPTGTLGLAVPAMPVGSPGMEVEDRFMPYEVLLLKDDGSTAVYARVTTPVQQYQ